MLGKIFVYALCALNLAGCITAAQRFTDQAEQYHFQHQVIKTDFFLHRIYQNNKADQESLPPTLHVYIDGDGSPWIKRQWIAHDPTSRNAMILELMAMDDSASILLGRPCYHGLHETSTCANKYWTSHRYSATVVKSMAQALNNWLTDHAKQPIVLIGYSGGGVLAMLIAPYIANVATVVTVAANLDVNAWSQSHGFLPLSDSLNPATDSQALAIKQIHLAGLKDQVVPADIISRFAQRQVNAVYYSYKNFDHQCCWVKAWPSILGLL